MKKRIKTCIAYNISSLRTRMLRVNYSSNIDKIEEKFTSNQEIDENWGPDEYDQT
jgi:hypothetical protein